MNPNHYLNGVDPAEFDRRALLAQMNGTGAAGAPTTPGAAPAATPGANPATTAAPAATTAVGTTKSEAQEPVKRFDQRANRGFEGWGDAAGQMTGFDLKRYATDIIPAGEKHPEWAAKKITSAQLMSNMKLAPPTGLDLKGREDWVRGQTKALVDQLKAQGEQVEWDGLDRIRFADAPQDGWIDVMQNKDWLNKGSGPVLWSWQQNRGGGGGSRGGGGGATGLPIDAGGRLPSFVPTDESTYTALQRRLQSILGSPSHDRQALMALMQQ